MADFDTPKLHELNHIVRTAMHATQTPGVAIGIVEGGRRWLGSFGVTNIENPLEVTPATLFQIGSITKTFTALGIALLQEEGKIEIDAPVRAYLPDFRVLDEEASATVKIRHLISHSSGWVGDVFRDTGQGDDALARYLASLKNVPQVFLPGTPGMWSYNNAAFAVAGRVIEVVSGMTVEEFLTQRILRPLGMTSSCLFARDAILQRVASGHNWGGERGPQVAHPWWKTRATSAVGSITSSVEEMVRYIRFQLARTGITEEGTRLLSADALGATHQPLAPAEPGKASGYSWEVDLDTPGRIIRHGGATVGQMAQCTVILDRGVGWIILTNGQRGNLVAEAVSAWLTREIAGIQAPECATVQASATDLQEYAGLYRARLTHVRLAPCEEGLRVETIPQGGYPWEDSPPAPAPPLATATRIKDDIFMVYAPPGKGDQADFVRDEQGRIAWLRIGGRLHKRD